MQRFGSIADVSPFFIRIEVAVDTCLELARRGHRRSIEQPDDAGVRIDLSEDILELERFRGLSTRRVIEAIILGQKQLFRNFDLARFERRERKPIQVRFDRGQRPEAECRECRAHQARDKRS